MKTIPGTNSLYAHFPFCETKCHYCDFFSLPESKVADNERQRSYSSIVNELRLVLPSRIAVYDTIFLGGGTPSLVPVETLSDVIRMANPAPGAEVTMEMNPSSITPALAASWRALGVNRVSMGVQALDDDRLRWLGRAHGRRQAVEALDALFSAGFENVSIDYIVGVPGQTVDLIRREIDEIVSLYPMIQHISAYLLTLAPKSRLARELPDEREQLAHLVRVRDTLSGNGFEQYEISNFARSGRESRHNENYWLGGRYLGIGPSAHSYEPSSLTRWKNWASLGKYAELVEKGDRPVEWTETLTPEQARLEYLMLRLRRRDGIDLNEYRHDFGFDLVRDRNSVITEWVDQGLCEVTDRLRLTGAGYFLSDKIVSSLI